MIDPNEAETSNSSETETLQKDTERLREDVAVLSRDARHSARGQAQAGIDKARERFGGLSHEIEARPYTGIVVAFGTGLLLGRLLGR